MTKKFQYAVVATIAVIYIIIIFGGVVRATGSGLGCPDWPKCYGDWVPPTSLDGLPSDIDPRTVNLTKTWIEYLNRTAGVLGGIFVLICLFYSSKVSRKIRNTLLLATGLFVFQGWLGGQVVKYELTAALVTAHLFLAILIVLVLQFAYWLSTNPMVRKSPLVLPTAFVGLVALAQVVIGTMVREKIEHLEMGAALTPREDWLPLGYFPDIFHRQLGVALLVVTFGMGYRYRVELKKVWRPASFFALLLFGQVATGLTMAYAGLPRVAQVLHLFLATAMFLALFQIVLSSKNPQPD